MENLSIVESDNLLLYESIIERGLKTFVEVGGALLAIRESKLYRQEYGTFEEYCKGRWSIERRRAYQLIDASIVVSNITNDVKNFSHRWLCWIQQLRHLSVGRLVAVRCSTAPCNTPQTSHTPVDITCFLE